MSLGSGDRRAKSMPLNGPQASAYGCEERARPEVLGGRRTVSSRDRSEEASERKSEKQEEAGSVLSLPQAEKQRCARQRYRGRQTHGCR